MARYRMLLLALVLSPLATGCASLPMLSMPLATDTQSAAAANPSQASVVVEVRPHRKKPKQYQLALEGEMYVQDALVKSRVVRKFRRMDVSVVRTSPEGRRLKMDCKYKPGKRQIAPEYDYALQPGDYIVITEDTSTPIDDMLAEAAGPLKVFTVR